MRVFEDIALTFGDDEYVIKGDNSIMLLIGKIESVITMQEMTSGDIPTLSKVAEAYAIALNHAGASTSVAEVYQSLFGGGHQSAANIVAALLSMMIPPQALRDHTAKMEAKAKAKAKATKKPARSKKPTK
jgi:hypothetical protein